jgi:hypothetical protein
MTIIFIKERLAGGLGGILDSICMKDTSSPTPNNILTEIDIF